MYPLGKQGNMSNSLQLAPKQTAHVINYMSDYNNNYQTMVVY